MGEIGRPWRVGTMVDINVLRNSKRVARGVQLCGVLQTAYPAVVHLGMYMNTFDAS